MLRAVIALRLQTIFEGKEVTPFYTDMLADGFTCAIVRWMMEKEPAPPEQFVSEMVSFLDVMSNNLCEQFRIKREREEAVSKRE